MKVLEITGGKQLNGTIRISGAKNSAVALVPAALLCDEEVLIDNIPNISDINQWLGGNIHEVGDSTYRPCKIRFCNVRFWCTIKEYKTGSLYRI